MNESDFEAQLRADGYTEIEAQKLAPRPGKGRHDLGKRRQMANRNCNASSKIYDRPGLARLRVQPIRHAISLRRPQISDLLNT